MVNRIAVVILAVATLTMIIPFTSIARAQSDFAAIQTFQDKDHIVITISKTGQPIEGPIVVVPPANNETNQNGTILTPGENVTAENPGNVTVIDPNGNVTEFPDSNVTVIDNDTAVITPPDRNVTETPGNVTVIDPAPPTENQSGSGSGCTCGNQTTPPVVVTPAPGQNVTTSNESQGFPATNQSGTSQPGGNESNPAGSTNQTGNTTGNETQTASTTINSQRMIPAMLANPVVEIHRIAFVPAIS